MLGCVSTDLRVDGLIFVRRRTYVFASRFNVCKSRFNLVCMRRRVHANKTSISADWREGISLMATRRLSEGVEPEEEEEGPKYNPSEDGESERGLRYTPPFSHTNPFIEGDTPPFIEVEPSESRIRWIDTPITLTDPPFENKMAPLLPVIISSMPTGAPNPHHPPPSTPPPSPLHPPSSPL